MKKLLALINARNKEFYRDRGTLGWTLFFPFIVLAGFHYGYSGRLEPVLKIGTTPEVVQTMPGVQSFGALPGISLRASEASDALKRLERYDLDLVVLASGNPGHFSYSLNEDSEKGKLALRLLMEAIARQPGARPNLELRPTTGRLIRYADWLLPGLLAMNIMFGSMFGVGYVIVRYRKNGVLKRLRATPLSAFQFLTAQVISRMLLMIVTSFMVLGGGMLLIGFRPQGSLVDFAVFLAVSAAAMISLGLVVAARISSEEVADGVLNIMTWPMIFLSGIWFSIEGASHWVIYAAKAMPLTHVVDGLRAILIDGAALSQVVPQVVVLLLLSALFIGIGSAIFRWR